VDDQTRDYFDRLMRETVDGRIALEEKVDKNTDQILTILDAQAKQLTNLTMEYHAISASVTRISTDVRRLEDGFRQEHLSREEARQDVDELRDRIASVEERLTGLESQRPR
jgi:chromosome segregation ATPase